MLGAVIGDIVGSVYEFNNIKTKEFKFFSEKGYFTDDTILTCASADWLLNGGNAKDFLVKWGNKYINRNVQAPQTPFGKGFMDWLKDKEHKPYMANTNGCVMRISPVAYLIRNTKEALKKAEQFSNVTHNHIESLNAVRAYIETVHKCFNKENSNSVRKYISDKYGYDLTKSVDEIRQDYNKFYCTCKNSVPQAIVCALEANSFEDGIRNAVSLGGDSDTLACMCGAIVEARFGIPNDIKEKAFQYLDDNIKKIIALEYDERIIDL